MQLINIAFNDVLEMDSLRQLFERGQQFLVCHLRVLAKAGADFVVHGH